MEVRRNQTITVTATNESYYANGFDDQGSMDEGRVFPLSGGRLIGSRGRQQQESDMMDKVFGEEMDGGSPARFGNCPMLNAHELSFLSDTPPFNTPSSYGARAIKQGRRVGPSVWHTSDWGGRSGGEELSSSFSEMRVSEVVGHERRKDKETVEKRISACARLERSGLVDASQVTIIKDRLMLGDYEDLNLALDEYVATSDATRFRALLETAAFRDDDDRGRGDDEGRSRHMANVGHEFDNLMDLDLSKAATSSLEDDYQSVANAAALAASSYTSSNEINVGHAPLSQKVTDDRSTTDSVFGDFEMEIESVLEKAGQEDGDVDRSVDDRERPTVIKIGLEAFLNSSDYYSEDEDDRVSSSKSAATAQQNKKRSNKSSSSSSSSSANQQQQQKKSVPGGRRKSATTPGSTAKKPVRSPGSGTRRKKKDDDDSSTHRRKSKTTPTSKGDPATPVSHATPSALENDDDDPAALKEEKKAAVSSDKTAKVLPATVEGAVSSTVTELPPLNELPEGTAPSYDVLINYPRAKARGTRHCVMCGRPSSPDRPPQQPQLQQQLQQQLPAPDEAPEPIASPDPTTTTAMATTTAATVAAMATPVGKAGDVVNHQFTPATPATPELPPATNDYAVIPKQNKDVCRECDKATWRHTVSGCFFKWCKGCKRFRNLVAFRGKLQASKCDNCRARGREGYMRRKETGEGNDEDASHKPPETPATVNPSEDMNQTPQQLSPGGAPESPSVAVAPAHPINAPAPAAVPAICIVASPPQTPTDVNMTSIE